MEITQVPWGFTPEGEVVLLYTLTATSGASVSVTNLGAALVSVCVPDRTGRLADVVLGYADWKSYLGDGPFMGKSVGRYANRIGGARFTLDGTEHLLAPNERGNQLHGGAATLANRIWEARVEGDNRVVFSVESPDGDGGYPGNLVAEAAYHWSDEGELEIVYSAECDAPTVVNFTNHSYFNLGGEASGSVLGHTLTLRASNFVPTRPDNIPTGEIWPVEGTPMDFRTAKTLGKDIDSDYPQLTDAAGYDRCWAIDGWRRNILGEAGRLTDPVSGRCMTILTSQPGVQLYTGNFLQGSPVGKSGRPYSNRDGVALECQGFPDAPNHPNFPSQVLRPGQRYIQKIVYIFGISQ
ncbi:MAG: galactose mutarotase [Alistipes sp.]|jgi:aldose 1-epimerase|nr:galactose mutarotase [Alistipes sp.]